MSTYQMPNPWEGRHQSVRHFAQVLTPNPNLPEGAPKRIAEATEDFALFLLRECQDGPELSTALRKLREAKDCAVLQAVIDARISG